LHFPVDDPFRFLLISGSLRRGSTNTAVLQTAAVIAPAGTVATRYDGVAALPAFNPDDDRLPLAPSVAALRAQVREADALVFSTPEYAGALPGSFKNVLDWCVGDDQPGSIYEKPVGWINVSSTGAVHAHDSLRLVLGYVNAVVVESACMHVPVARQLVGSDGLFDDPGVRAHIIASLTALADWRATASQER
jgi:chromate reductase